MVVEGATQIFQVGLVLDIHGIVCQSATRSTHKKVVMRVNGSRYVNLCMSRILVLLSSVLVLSLRFFHKY